MKKGHVSRRCVVRLAAFTAAFFVAATAAVWKAEKAEREQAAAETALGYTYQKSLAELASYVDNIDTALEKGLCSGTAEGKRLQAAKVWREAAAAKACLASLPYADGRLENTGRFLSQVGEYAYALTRKTEDGSVTPEEEKTVQKLSGYASGLKAQLYDLLSSAAADGYDFSSVTDKLSLPVGNGTDVFVQMEGSYEDYPSLIYDGPFSDHLQKGEQKALAQEREISQEEAEKIAASFTNGRLSACEGRREGTPPVYVFAGDGEYLELTVRGGKVLNFVSTRPVGEPRHTREEAVARGEELLRAYGLPSMTATYTLEDENTLLINFAATQGDTVCYPDLIKLRIALDDLSLVGAEASGYLANHTARQKPETTLSPEEARKSINPALTIEKIGTAFVCPGGLTEYYVYEFTCTADTGRRVLCYIDAVTGREVDLLLLLDTPGGTLTV